MPMMPTAFISIPLYVNPIKNLKGVTITFPSYTGSFSFQITGNGRDASPTWTSITPSPNTTTTIVFSLLGDYFQYRILGIPGTVINGGLNIKLNF